MQVVFLRVSGLTGSVPRCEHHNLPPKNEAARLAKTRPNPLQRFYRGLPSSFFLLSLKDIERPQQMKPSYF
uniref:Uncharacterized protein n=1 Tax=Cyanoderma ruficeps TaxID=181631 RepID=A0A8C3R634_9PASS